VGEFDGFDAGFWAIDVPDDCSCIIAPELESWWSLVEGIDVLGLSWLRQQEA
jgi:hypothetical protein